MNCFNRKKPRLAWSLCHLLNKEFSFFSCLYHTKEIKIKKELEPCLKKERGDKKKKEKKEYVSLNENTRYANGAYFKKRI